MTETTKIKFFDADGRELQVGSPITDDGNSQGYVAAFVDGDENGWTVHAKFFDDTEDNYGAQSREDEYRLYCDELERLEVVKPAHDQPTDKGGAELTPDECQELFSLWLCHGMKPPEIYEGHPAYTGAMKLGQAQPHPEDGHAGDPLALPTQPKEETGVEWPEEIYLVADEGVPWMLWYPAPKPASDFESRPYVPKHLYEQAEQKAFDQHVMVGEAYTEFEREKARAEAAEQKLGEVEAERDRLRAAGESVLCGLGQEPRSGRATVAHCAVAELRAALNPDTETNPSKGDGA